MRVPKDVLKVARCTNPEAETRPLRAVRLMRLTEDRCRAEATDGWRAIRVTFTEPTSEQLFGDGVSEQSVAGCELLVPMEAAIDTHKAVDNDPGYAIIDENPQRGQVTMFAPGPAQLHRIDAAAVTGAFPEIEAVLPKYKLVDVAGEDADYAVRVAINPTLLAELLKVSAEATDSEAPVFMDVPMRRGKPVRLLIGDLRHDNAEVVSLLMPVNEDSPRRRITLIDGKPDGDEQMEMPMAQSADETPAPISAPLASAMKDLAGIVDGDRISSLEISVKGSKPVVIDATAAKRVQKNADKIIAGGKRKKGASA